jgi:hypothetical protein
MKSYRVSCGNSTRGPVGLCGCITAGSKAEALMKVRRALGDAVGASGELPVAATEPGIDYVNVYLSPENIELSDISED